MTSDIATSRIFFGGGRCVGISQGLFSCHHHVDLTDGCLLAS